MRAQGCRLIDLTAHPAATIILLLMVIFYPLARSFCLGFFAFTGLRERQAAFAGLRYLAGLKDDRICFFSMKNTLFSNLFS